MPDNESHETAFTLKVTCSSSDQIAELLVNAKQVNLVADGDCFVNFNKPVTVLGRFLIKANTPYVMDFAGGVSTVHYLAASGTPALYICATR